jgi:hypothetical protein
MGLSISSFNPLNYFRAGGSAPAANLCKGVDVNIKPTDNNDVASEKIIDGFKRFLRNSAFEGKTDAETDAVPQHDRWNAMAVQANKLAETKDAWKKFQGAGCNFGFPLNETQETGIKQLLGMASEELRDPFRAEKNAKY